MNLNNSNQVAKALETNDSSILNEEQMVYYDDIQKYLSGDIIGGYGSMKTFGNDMSAFQTINYYYDNQLYVMDEFTTGPTQTMGQKMSTVTDKVMEYYTKVIMGIESTDSFDDFLQELNTLGLDKITEELNEWYTSK